MSKATTPEEGVVVINANVSFSLFQGFPMKSPIKRASSTKAKAVRQAVSKRVTTKLGAAKKMGGKALAKKAGGKIIPTAVASMAVRDMMAAKTLGGKIRALADITLPTMVLGMAYDGTTPEARKAYQEQRIVEGDRGRNPTMNPNEYRKRLAKSRNPKGIQGKL